MRRFLLEKGWIPGEKEQETKWLEKTDPWIVREKGLDRELTVHEFGRVLLHMSQRRGAYGFGIDEENEDAGGKDEG